MNRFFKIAFLTALIVVPFQSLKAGNPDRVGQAGGTQVVYNPWARSAGWMGANIAGISGVEAMRFNVAGLVATEGTEVLFSHSQYLVGSGISTNSFGISTRVGAAKESSLGLSIMSYGFGEIDRTDGQNPDGGLGTFSPQWMNIGVAYSHIFSNSIRGGALVRIVSEGIDNARASGIALDAGIQYSTGEHDRTRFGVALRNVGTPMRYEGDGMSIRATLEGQDQSRTVESRTEQFELPSVLSIGMSYDFFLSQVDSTLGNNPIEHKLTAAATFVSHAFSRDQLTVGLEYSFKRVLQVRAGYAYERGDFTSEHQKLSITSGPSAGASINVPLGRESTTTVGIDYAWRATQHFSGIHTFGARLNL